MGIRYSVSSEFSDYEGDGWVPEHQIGFWPDVHAGRIILAKCQGEQKGVDVCVANGLFIGENMPDSMAYDLMAKAFIRKRLNVWDSLNLPITLPEGEPGNVRLLARPVIWVWAAGEADISSEDYF